MPAPASDTDISALLEAKSDQLNAADLISGPIVCRIVSVKVKPGGGEQPMTVTIADVSGEPRKPWKPCKGMMRLMAEAWGTTNPQTYVGRHIRLMREPTVVYGGVETGGIRIDSMSDVKGSFTFPLRVSQRVVIPWRVAKLVPPAARPDATSAANKPTPLDEFRVRVKADLNLDPATVEAWVLTEGGNAARMNAGEFQSCYADLADTKGEARAAFDKFAAERGGMATP